MRANCPSQRKRMSSVEISPRRRIRGRGVAVVGDDIDTDRILPARFATTLTFEGLEKHAFADDRRQCARSGTVHPFDDSRYAGAEILLVGRNFGCGSAREHAPQALIRSGIRAVVAISAAGAFRENCTALGVPVVTADAQVMATLTAAILRSPVAELTVDLEERCIAVSDDASFAVDIPDRQRSRLMAGRWDTLVELSEAVDKIRLVAEQLPYRVQTFVRDGKDDSAPPVVRREVPRSALQRHEDSGV